MLTRAFASKTPPEDAQRWRTPGPLFAALNARYGPFVLDCAADAQTHICPLWLGPGGLAPDALAVPWQIPGQLGGRPIRAFCNPPYARGKVDAFARKAHREAAIGNARTTLLCFATVEQPWWHDLVWDDARNAFRPGVLVEFPKKRIKFLRPDGTPGDQANFASVVVTFGGW